jgi:hypothetical protein
MSTPSDGLAPEPAAQPVPQTRRPPVPGTAPSDPSARRDHEAGVHRTEQVPFPLPPLPEAPADARPSPVAGPATGQLDLSDYPPRLSGRRRRGEGTDQDDQAPA